MFASEEYGFRLAEVLGARYVPVDQARGRVDISATAVRADPMTNWEFIPPPVRPWFVRRVCLIGPESTGKTVLAERLARHFRTVWVAEYARGWIDAHGGPPTAEMFETFLRGQAASEEALARQANRILICDTDAFTTALYHEIYVGPAPDLILKEADRRSYDLYLLCRHDTPYAGEAQRTHESRRPWFFDRRAGRLAERGARYVVVEGDWEARFEIARRAVEGVLAVGGASNEGARWASGPTQA